MNKYRPPTLPTYVVSYGAAIAAWIPGLPTTAVAILLGIVIVSTLVTGLQLVPALTNGAK